MLGTEQYDAEAESAERTTTKYMTKYERARILGTRALQIRCMRTVRRQRSSPLHNHASHLS